MNLQPSRQDFRFSHRLRVRWAEVDMQKIVFNAHYLMYFDTAIGDYWRAMALPYEDTMHHWGGDLYVKKASVEFFASARYDDQLDVMLKCSKIGNSSIIFTGALFRADELLVTTELIYVFANPASQTSQPIPPALRESLTGFEAGEAMTTVKTGTWDELGQDAARLRVAVFVEEQGIPLEMEWDEADKTALHAVAYNRLGVPLATGRLLPSEVVEGVAASKIGRMAVNRVMRGAKLGRDVLHALMSAAKARGDDEIALHAQCSAENFYSRLGFTPRGESFDEVGIAHQEMVCRL
ncbi:MAG: YbgC/FadM family acyl-CoA thioesterase [Burkholderiaceae bacterium]|nr:YbgC/FadM family acyl-CoA thioesterase [Burkholderiaceae bacterium]